MVALMYTIQCSIIIYLLMLQILTILTDRTVQAMKDLLLRVACLEVITFQKAGEFSSLVCYADVKFNCKVGKVVWASTAWEFVKNSITRKDLLEHLLKTSLPVK